jgi:hypothetical protein
MKLPAAALAAFALAACNSQGNGGQAGGSAAGSDPAGTVSMRPGLWETTMRIVSVDAPNAPPEIQGTLRAASAAAPVSQRSCMTPAEAANPGAAVRDRTVRAQTGFTCETGETLFAGGRIRMTLTCRSQSGLPDQRTAMVGSFTADTLQVAVSAETATPASEMMQSFPVRVESTLTGRRIGDCPAGATN